MLEETIENNRLIAEFMGWIKSYPNMTDHSKNSRELQKQYAYGGQQNVFHESMFVDNIIATTSKGSIRTFNIWESIHLKDMQFNLSWDWLMPVVEKIENEIGHAVSITQTDCVIYMHNSENSLNELLNISGKTKIEVVYKAMVEFIKWHNAN